MRFKSFLTSVIATLILASFASAQITSQPPISFSTRKFHASLKTSVADQVMGYQYVLIKNGVTVAEKAGGVRQRTPNGDLPMTLDTPSNIASLTKFLSGTAMLHLMEKTQSWDAGQTVDQKLDREFTTIVPFTWATGNTPGVEMIKLRQLLQHRSGFDDQKPVGNRTVLGFLKDDDGFVMSQYDQREYSNINFVLNGYLIPFYAAPTLKNAYNAVIFNQGMQQPQADAYIRQNAGTTMHNIMKARIWDNMSPAFLPNCDATNTIPNTAAYGYTSRNDAPGGNISSAIDSQGHCGGHGGYYMSARDLANYVGEFSSTSNIVSTSTKNLMFSNSMSNFDDRLVWSSATYNQWIDEKFGLNRIAWSDGLVTSGYRGVILRLPQNYYLVMLTNSKELNSTPLYNAGVQAFIDAVEHNFD